MYNQYEANRLKSASGVEVLGKLTAAVLMIALAAAIGFLNTAYLAYVIGKVWSWFLLPVGYAVPAFETIVGVLLLIGLGLANVYVLIMGRQPKTPSENLTPFAQAVSASLLLTISVTFAWAAAAIWRFWILG